jgi:hypothetical protein
VKLFLPQNIILSHFSRDLPFSAYLQLFSIAPTSVLHAKYRGKKKVPWAEELPERRVIGAKVKTLYKQQPSHI